MRMYPYEVDLYYGTDPIPVRKIIWGQNRHVLLGECVRFKVEQRGIKPNIEPKPNKIAVGNNKKLVWEARKE